jgi:hypothetical protein
VPGVAFMRGALDATKLAVHRKVGELLLRGIYANVKGVRPL